MVTKYILKLVNSKCFHEEGPGSAIVEEGVVWAGAILKSVWMCKINICHPATPTQAQGDTAQD